MTDPDFLATSFEIAQAVKGLEHEEFERLLTLKADAAPEYYALWQDFPADRSEYFKKASPAAVTFQGIAYQYLNAQAWDLDDWQYAKEHLRVVSGLYGLLSPSDAVCLYRLEMKHNIPVAAYTNLYKLWSDRLGKRLNELSDGLIVNLMSQEYAKATLPYLDPKIPVVNCDFRIKNKAGEYKTQATWAKISRGAMASHIITQKIESLEGLKEFNHAGFYLSEGLSTADRLIFLADKPFVE